MSASTVNQKESTYKNTWLQWDKAWDLDISHEARVAFLEECAGASFVWSNAEHIVKDRNLSELAKIIEQLLQQAGNKLTVKHINWWEHHQQGALQWDMVHVDTGAWLVSGVSHGTYDEQGKLLSVTDFY